MLARTKQTARKPQGSLKTIIRSVTINAQNIASQKATIGSLKTCLRLR